MNIHDDRPASVILSVYGAFFVFFALFATLVALCYFATVGLPIPATSRPANELSASMQLSLALAPFILMIGVSMLACAYYVSRGSSQARWAGQAILVVYLIGQLPYGLFWLSRPTTFPTVVMEMMPGLLGIVIQIAFIVLGIPLSLFFVGIPMYILWKPNRT